MTGKHANKVVASIAEALEPLRDGMTIMCGGFGLSGNPEALIKGVVERGAKDLTLISNNAGNLGKGLATWLKAGIIRKVICSYIGTNDDLHTRMASGEVKVEITPQGTLAERMRAGGAGIPGFYTKTGVGTQVAEGNETKVFDGDEYILERGIFADLAIVKAWKADATGNLVFRKTARNFNLPAATCGKTCVVEVEEIVPVGSLDPDCIHLPGVYVQRMIVGAPYDKKIEFTTTREREVA